MTEQVAFLQLRLCVCDMGIDPCSESFIKIKEDNSYKAACVTSTIYKGLGYTVALLFSLFSIPWGRGWAHTGKNSLWSLNWDWRPGAGEWRALLTLMASSVVSIQKSHPFALLEQLLQTMPVLGVLMDNPAQRNHAGWLVVCSVPSG